MKTNDIDNLSKEGSKLEKESPVKMRQIIIETDGVSINIAKADVTSQLEFVGILKTLMDFINKAR